MLESKDAVLDALRANDARPYGRQRTVTAEELVDAAEQFDDTNLLVSALHELLEAYEYDAEQRKQPVVFARLLKLWDQEPDAFHDWARDQLFWRFKWIAGALLSVPEVPLEAVRRWHTEMRDRYRAAGHELQPYHAQRYHLAAHTGAGRDHAFDLWATRPRTRFSDCAACETRARAVHRAHAGDDARALEVWQPVLAGDQVCTEEPYTSHAHALLPQLRLGRTDQARSSHLVGYRYARGKSGAAALIGLHLEFCALSGNQARGLEILAENRDLFDQHGNPLARLEFLTGAGVLLARLADDGHGEVAVSGPPGATWTVATLNARVGSEAAELAARFDSRNGTDAVGARLRQRLAQRPLSAEPLALGVRAAALAPAGSAPVPPPVRPLAEPLPQDFAELLRRARELTEVAHPDAAALWRRIEERLGAGEAVPAGEAVEQLRAELALQRYYELGERRHRAQEQSELAAAQALFEEIGNTGAAIATRARRCVREDEQDTAVVDWTELERLTEQAERLRTGDAGDAGDPPGMRDQDHVVLLQCRALGAYHDLVAELPHPDPEAVARFRTEVAAYQHAASGYGIPHRAATAHCYRADVHARQGEFEEAEAELRQALGLLETAGQSWLTARPLAQLGQVKMQRGRPAEAAPVLHRTLAEAARWEAGSFPFGPAYAMLGQACEQLGDTAGAIRALSEAAARFDRAEATGDAVRARLQLANVLRGTGRVADAVAVLETALLDSGPGAGAAATPEGDDDERVRAQLRLSLARDLSTLGEHRDAAEVYLRLADTVADWQDPGLHTMVACEATIALAEAGSWEAAQAARERALRSHAKDPRADQTVCMLVEFARLTVSADGPQGLPAALELLSEADALRERALADGTPATGWHLAGVVHEGRARAYALCERFEDALASAESAIAGYQAGGAPAEEARAEAVRLAALIEGRSLGRVDAARARLAATIARCEQAGLGEAAQALGALRDHLGAA